METMMTDDRIAELLGWQPERRTWRDSSLMHRIRLIVAEAQAEQDGHIYRLREQIARDTAQIERMRSALTAARSVIDLDRLALLDAHTDWQGRVDEAGAAAAAQYDETLRMIDEAMGEPK